MNNTTGKHKNILAGIGLLALLSGGPLSAQAPMADTDGQLQQAEQVAEPTQQTEMQTEPLLQSSSASDDVDVSSAVSEAAATQIVPLKIAGRSATSISPPPISSPPKINSSANLMNLVLGLGLIIGLIFALSWLVRRMGQGGLLTSNQMKIVAAMPLGTRERIVVIEVGGQQLLLGITATKINTLHVFPEPIIDSQQVAGQSEFGKKLMAILQQKSVPQAQTNPTPEFR